MLTLLVLWACETPRSYPQGPRVALVGIDGGDWDILDPMIGEGHLPNLAKIRQEGCTANLVIDSAQSPNSWMSIATGHHPEEHGIQQGNSGVGGTFGATQEQIKKHRIWDMTSRWGRSTFVINYWITAPAYAINGVMISREGDSAFPPGIDGDRGFDVTPAVHAEEITRMGVGLLRSGSMQSQLAKGDFDLIVLPFYGHDQSLHMLYAEWEAAQQPEKLEGLGETTRKQIVTGFEIVKETARLGDDLVGWAMDYVGEDGYVVLFSDHGHTRANPNERRVALSRSVLDGQRGTIEHGSVQLEGATLKISHRMSTPVVNPLDYRMRVPVITIENDPDGTAKETLLALVTPSGSPLLTTYRGGGLTASRELIDTCGRTLGKYEGPQFSCFVNSGSHGLEDLGVFGVLGPGVVPGETTAEVETVDVTPTALWLMRLPTGEDLAGAPVTPCLQAPPEVATIPTYETGKRPWTAQPPGYQDDVQLQEWLKSMGYMD
ncbi:MAG TPA: alkaline phosphatase family protein [Myxococcota bacterium]|nr:alkaline phosphatase family protein [Myxococcota bacterium]